MDLHIPNYFQKSKSMDMFFENIIFVSRNILEIMKSLFGKGWVSANPGGQCLEMVGSKKLKLNVGESKTIGFDDRFEKSRKQHVVILKP